MAVITNIMDYLQVAEAVQATGTWNSVAEAVESGAVYQAGQQLYTAFQVIDGGAAAPITSLQDSALEIATQAGAMGATAAAVKTAAGTILRNATTGVVKAAGLLTLEVPTAAAACAPLAGVALGSELYNANPQLWTKISQTLLPFCYEENKIQAFCDFVTDVETGIIKPIVLLPTTIIDALKSLFEKEEVKTIETIKKTDSLGRTITGGDATYAALHYSIGYPDPNKENLTVSGSGMAYAGPTENQCYFIDKLTIEWDYKGSHFARTFTGWQTAAHDWGIGSNPYTDQEIENIANDPEISPQTFPPTAGVSAPAVPAEPIVWPNIPIIVVPDPLGPDYQPIPVTPVTPALPPAPETPLLPEPAPDPTPEKPDEWPEEDPWPTVIPSPFQPTEPETDPDPNIPYIPWPLPERKPNEDDPEPEYWPNYPPSWPGEYPKEFPWPSSPEEWPEQIPWPEVEPGEEPEWWPDGEPWPESPEDWPEEVPWPTSPEEWPGPYPEKYPWPNSPEEWPEQVPWPEVDPETKPEWWPEGEPWPESPEDWPEEVPWPLAPPWPFPWPDNVPYPWPFPYPYPSPDPYPDPREIEDPQKRVDPYIDPWPFPWPDPYPNPQPRPDPYSDPSQPDPIPQPDPDPTPEPQPDPTDPYPTPPKGTPTPPAIPYIPLPFSQTTGLISVYHPTQSELLAFAQWLWVTWQDATIDKIWNNPFDGVISLFELYCTPTDVGRKNIRSGFLDSGVSSETVSRYTELNCGSIAIPEYYGNYFDYSPYSKCHIFLPFIGIVELNVDDIVGHGVNVTYRIDEYNGSCIAMVTVAKSTEVNGDSVDYSVIMYQFSGNCAVELPLSGGSQASIKAGMLEAAAWGLGSVISGVITGGAGGGLGIGASIGNNLAQGAASAVHSVVSAKSSVQHSGSFGSSYGAMGGKIPYIIVTRPKQIQVPNYNELYGYQAHKMVRVGDCTGYLRCREAHIISPTASDEEKMLIEQFMKTGVYVTE